MMGTDPFCMDQDRDLPITEYRYCFIYLVTSIDIHIWNILHSLYLC